MPVELTCPDGSSDTGAYRLSWTGPEGARFSLVETDAAGQGVQIYDGEDVATTVSGRPAGEYTYHLAAGTAPPSMCKVTVAPPSMATAALFFGFGLVVCIATVTVVVRGHRAHRRGELS